MRVLRDQLAWFNNETLDIHILRHPRGTDARPEEKPRVTGGYRYHKAHVPPRYRTFAPTWSGICLF